MLPNDPMILFSYLNTKLRDEYRDLEALCDAQDADMEAVLNKMEKAGYVYDPAGNRFISK